MNRRYVYAVLTAAVVVLAVCAACGGEARQSAADTNAGAGNTADAAAPSNSAPNGSACASVAVPKEHRAVAQVCPTARGSIALLDMSKCTTRVGIQCTQDADCTAGKNGRCFANSTCYTVCSYDECSTDSDCAAGPCLCRSSGSDTVENDCLPGSNCKTDADCSDGCGYCSPSAIPAPVDCTVGTLTYNCHTASDECENTSSCGDGAYCAYDAGTARWGCGFCVPYPHP